MILRVSSIVVFLFLALNPNFLPVQLQNSEQEKKASVEAEDFLDSAEAPKRISNPEKEPSYYFIIGKTFAVINIPKLKVKYPIKEGISLDVLDRAVGHYPGTVGPGQTGNLSLAGHSCCGEHSSPFQRQAELEEDDEIIVETLEKEYTYKVTTLSSCGTRYSNIVNYTDISVIYPVPCQGESIPTRKLLTLTTCTPVQSAFTAWRLVTWAELVSTKDK